MTAFPEQQTWNQHNAASAGQRWWPCEELVRAVSRYEATRNRRLGRVLEVGCGNGANLWFLAERAREVIGLDFSAVALEQADHHIAARDTGYGRLAKVDLLQASATALPLAEASVDAVVDCMLSQHVPWASHPALYREYRRVLRPGGWLFLYHLTNKTTRPAGLDTADCPWLPLFPDAGLVCLPGALSLELAVERAGFGAIETRGLTREYPDRQTAHYAVMEGTAR